MSAEIIPIGAGEVGAGVHIEPANVIMGAPTDLRDCLVIGTLPNDELYVACTDGPTDALWLLEKAKLKILGVE